MIRQYANITASTSSAGATTSNSTHQDLKGGNTAAKVAEVFLTAGHAFQKLGDLTLQLHSSDQNNSEKKWTDEDVDRLKNALTRFAHELDNISESVQTRTTKLIKTDIKRRTLASTDDLSSSSPISTGAPAPKRFTTVGQLLASQNQSILSTKRSAHLGAPLTTGACSSTTISLASSTSVASNSNARQPTTFSGSSMYSGSRSRYTPIAFVASPNSNPATTTTPSVAATVTLHSSPQPIANVKSTNLSNTYIQSPQNIIRTTTQQYHPIQYQPVQSSSTTGGGANFGCL